MAGDALHQLSYMLHLGHDIEGVQATIVSCHEGISHSLADEVISVLESVGDIVRIDGELYVRPGTDPKVRPPIPMPPPPAPPPSAAEQVAMLRALQQRRAQEQLQRAQQQARDAGARAPAILGRRGGRAARAAAGAPAAFRGAEGDAPRLYVSKSRAPPRAPVSNFHE